MSIVKLPPEVISKIAAGEVVERPSSVVKELMENSLDARATQVEVEVRGGGVLLLRVSDDGEGMLPEEMELAFQRYATSKVGTVRDLEHIVTLGFRGEALPSIAAMAEVTLVSRVVGADSGSYIRLKDGALLERGRRGSPLGTTVTVRNLFSSFPARRKFLKSTAREVGTIGHLVTQYALAYPEVRFLLTVDGRKITQSPGTGRLRESIMGTYGLEIAQAMLAIEEDGEAGDPLPAIGLRPDHLFLVGLVSPPAISGANRNRLSFFVNRRWIQSPLLTKAVEEAYRDVLMKGRYPLGVIHLFLPPNEVDVNVHPTKKEIRFLREGEVFVLVNRAVRSTVAGRTPIPVLVPRISSPPMGEEQIRMGMEVSGLKADLSTGEVTSPDVPSLPILRVVGQMGGTYIIAEGPDGMYLIDQHTAHERVLYEKIRSQWERDVGVQGLLEPLVAELTPAQIEAFQRESERLAKVGFQVEPFGEKGVLIRSVPAVIIEANLVESFTDILEVLGEAAASPDCWDRISTTLACHGAVRAGDSLSIEEMRELVRQLEQASSPRTCPHGRPTMIHLSIDQLEKEFGRR